MSAAADCAGTAAAAVAAAELAAVTHTHVWLFATTLTGFV